MDFWSQHQQQQQQNHRYQSWQSQSYHPPAYNYLQQSYNYNSTYHNQYPNIHSYAPNYPNAYEPQPQTEPPIHPPGVSAPSTAAVSQGQVPSSENAYQPQQAATASTNLTNSAPTTGAAIAGLQQGPQWYSHPDEYAPVVGGPGLELGLGTIPYHLSHPPVARSPQTFGGRPSRGGAHGKSFRGKGHNHSRGGSGMVSSSIVEASVGKNTNNNRQAAGASTTNRVREANGKGITASTHGAARCELCNADCTSLVDLEQHKAGKRHKKNVARMESLKNSKTPINIVENDQTVYADSNTVTTLHTENLSQVEEGNPGIPEKLASETTTYPAVQGNQEKAEPENPDVPLEAKNGLDPKKRRVNWLNDHRHGPARNLRGGKWMRTSGAPRQGTKPKVVIPLVCDLCNVKCDTQEVLNNHLSGKKHMAKLKRFEGHQAMFGAIGLQALYPPNPVTQTLLFSHAPQQATPVTQSSDPCAGASMPSQTQPTVP